MKLLWITIIATLISRYQAFVNSPASPIARIERSSTDQRTLIVQRQRLPVPTTTMSMSAIPLPDSADIARFLGYVVGAGSLLLYTPIAVRLFRQKTAEGLVTTTWWLKISSYTASDIYAYTHGYPLSTYIETLIITGEAALVLFLVVYYQKRLDARFWSMTAIFGTTSLYLLTAAPSQVVALGQGASAILNTGALVPQFLLNQERQKAGDYSPLTAGLASIGCLVRVFTTVQLAGSDPLLLASFSVALLLNSALFVQILYLGTQVEGRSFRDVLLADVQDTDDYASQGDMESSGGAALSMYQREEYAEDIPMVTLNENTQLNERRINDAPDSQRR